MSIVAYTGLPGSGKSYAVVEYQILPALKAGRRVVTNVPMNRELLDQAKLPGELVECPVELLASKPEAIWEYVTPGSVFVLDEVWRLFPAGLRANKVPEPFRSLLAEHRHMVDAQGNSTQVVLVTQDLAQIAAFARQLVESTFRSTKLSVIGADKKFRVDVYQGPITGPNPNVQQRIREIYGTYKPEVYKFYKSHTMSQAANEGANESKIDQRGQAWKKPSIVVGLLAAPLMVFFGFKYALASLPGRSDEPAQVDEQFVNQDDKQAAQVITPWRQAQPDRSTSSWRIGGVIGPTDNPRMARVLITNGELHQVITWNQGSCTRSNAGLVSCRYQGHQVEEYLVADRSHAAAPDLLTESPIGAGSVVAPGAGQGGG